MITKINKFKMIVEGMGIATDDMDSTLILVWSYENPLPSNENPLPLLMAYFITKDKQKAEDFIEYTGQGIIADILQQELNRRVESDEFSLELCSMEDWIDSYGAFNNPNRTNIGEIHRIDLDSPNYQKYN